MITIIRIIDKVTWLFLGWVIHRVYIVEWYKYNMQILSHSK